GAPVPEMESRVGQEVAHARDHTSHRRGGAREGIGPGYAWLLVYDGVPGRDAVGDRFVGVEAAFRHAERDEQELPHGRFVRLTCGHLDEPAEHREARVRVMPDLAEWRELLELGHRRDVTRERVVAFSEVGEAIAEPAAGVRDEVPEGRGLRGVIVADLELGEVAADRRIPIERAALAEAHDDPSG